MRVAGCVIVAGLAVGITCSGFAGEAAVNARGDLALRRTLELKLPRVMEADRLAANGRGSPAQIQAQYDAARDLQEALAAIAPVSEGCRRLLGTARAFARAEILQAEGVDRPSPALLATGIRRAASAKRTLARLPRNCSRGSIVKPSPAPSELDQPRSGEAFTGRAGSLAPPKTDAVEVVVGRSIVGRATLTGRRARFDLSGSHRGRRIEFRFRSDGELLGTARSLDTWLLPRSSERHRAAGRGNRVLTARLARLASEFDGQAGIWIHDLSTGAAAGWNEDARFPAASTVKLAVLIATLNRFGPRPERSRVAYDLRALSAWSSNLAANRLVRILGRGSTHAGSRITETVLRRLGANSSSYPGEYLIGTVSVPIGLPTSARSLYSLGTAPDPPPRVSSRVTSACDLGRILYLLDAAAMGHRPALSRTGLTRHEARVGIALLLASEPKGDNLGLLRPSAGRAMPIAQKNGWRSDVRHTAAILYTSRGPSIVVVLTYRPGITKAAAAALGARVLKAVGTIPGSSL